MFRLRTVFAFGLLAALTATEAAADSSYWDTYYAKPKVWSVSVWTGPNARKWAGAIVQDYFNLQSRGMIAGVALDRKIGRLGRDIYLSGEIQINQTYIDHADTIFNVNLGLQFDNLFGYERTSFAVFTGPSYDLDPARWVITYDHREHRGLRKKFLNTVTAEFASGLPFTENWDWTVRFYHRSGVFGLYSRGDDDGLSFGLGLKYHF